MPHSAFWLTRFAIRSTGSYDGGGFGNEESLEGSWDNASGRSSSY